MDAEILDVAGAKHRDLPSRGPPPPPSFNQCNLCKAFIPKSIGMDPLVYPLRSSASPAVNNRLPSCAPAARARLVPRRRDSSLFFEAPFSHWVARNF